MKAEGHLELTTSLARILQTSLSPFLAASFMDLVTLASSLRMAVTWRVAGHRSQVTGHRCQVTHLSLQLPLLLPQLLAPLVHLQDDDGDGGGDGTG